MAADIDAADTADLEAHVGEDGELEGEVGHGDGLDGEDGGGGGADADDAVDLLVGSEVGVVLDVDELPFEALASFLKSTHLSGSSGAAGTLQSRDMAFPTRKGAQHFTDGSQVRAKKVADGRARLGIVVPFEGIRQTNRLES